MLKDWEIRWQENFGGEERDEVESEIDDSDDEDGKTARKLQWVRRGNESRPPLLQQKKVAAAVKRRRLCRH